MRVGIVIPTRGMREEWLAEAVASVEKQEENVSLAIVAPPDVGARIRAQFPGRVVLTEGQPGIVPAIKAGWRHLADCDALSWLGDDDVLTPGSVGSARRVLERYEQAAMVFGDYDYVDAGGSRIATVRPGRFAPLWLRLGQNFIGQPGCLYRREMLDGRLRDELALAFDVSLHLSLAARARYCPSILARVRIHPSRLTVARRANSTEEMRRVVWGRYPRPVRSFGKNLEPVWRLGGRVYYRFHREY